MSDLDRSRRPLPDQTDVELERIAHAFRPNLKRLAVAVLANLVLAILFLGLPYLRGRQMAVKARRDFARVTNCLIGGEIVHTFGLSLPKGDRDHFASKVMHEAAGWPLCCRPLLRKLAPPPAFFLWPGVKQAGIDLRAAVRLAEKEIKLLDQRRKLGLRCVPVRGLEALRRVQAATVLLARAADTENNLESDVVRWKVKPKLSTPVRLPLAASDDAILDLYSDGKALDALALDRRGVSYLRLADGKVERERAPRTGFVRGALRVNRNRYLVWAIPDALCAERSDHCVGRPMGLAPYDKAAATLKEPRWKLAGHPAGRIDRALRVTESGSVAVLARASEDGAVELLRFQIEHASTTAPNEQRPSTIEPLEWFSIASGAPVLDAALVTAGTENEPPAAISMHASDSGIDVLITWADALRAPLVLPKAHGEHPWTITCSTDDAHILAYGSASELHLLRLDASGLITPLLQHTDAIEHALHAKDPALDRLQLLCRGNYSQLIWSNATNELWNSVCERTRCNAPARLAERVTRFTALLAPPRRLVAFGNPADEIRVLRLDSRGNPLGKAYTPAACFEPRSGMCGTPGLILAGKRVILTARDHSDLLVLESTDDGASFTSLQMPLAADNN